VEDGGARSSLSVLTPHFWVDAAKRIDISRYMDVSDVIGALDALAQESRLAIFRLLVEAGPEGLMMGAIGERLDLPHATLSFHLDKMRQAGLVVKRRDGRATIYSTNYDTLVGAIRYLTENCCKDSAHMPCRIVIEDKATEHEPEHP